MVKASDLVRSLEQAMENIAYHPHQEVTEDDGSRHIDWEWEATSMRLIAKGVLGAVPRG